MTATIKGKPKYKVGDVVENVYAGAGNPTFVSGKIVEVAAQRSGFTGRGFNRERYEGEARYKVDFGNGRVGWADENALEPASKSYADKAASASKSYVPLIRQLRAEARKAMGPGTVVAKASLTEDSGERGGYLVPTGFSYALLETVAEHSFIEPRAMVVPMTTRETLCPKVNDHPSGIGSGTSPFFGGWNFSWNQAAPDSNVADFGSAAPFGQMSLVAWDLIGELLVSNQFLDDITEEGEAKLFELAARAAAWSKEWAFLNGRGAANFQPMGVLHAPCAIDVQRAGSNAIAIADVTKMARHMLPLGWNHSIWAVSPYAVEQLMKITGFVPNEDPLGTEMGCVGSLLTRPVFATEKLPTLGTRGDLVFFDPSMYVVGNRLDVEVSVSQTGPSFRANSSYVKVWLRCDGRPLLDASANIESAGADQNVSCIVVLADPA